MLAKKEKYGYYYLKNEKEISKEEYLNNNVLKNSYYFNNVLNITENIDDFKYIYSNNKLLGCKYQSLVDNANKYQDITSIIFNIGTTGLATGNTIEEALVQGSSELFERIAVERFFYEPQDQYYQINEKSLSIQHQNKINKLKNLGLQVEIYDLSYNFQLPVVFLIVYNLKYKTCFYRFGSHPIFDIALERCFTELYQGYIELPAYNNINLNYYEQSNAYSYIRNTNIGILAKSIDVVMPSFIVNKNNQIVTYNTNYFYNSIDYSNKELLSHIKYLTKLNNYHFYWLDISLSDKIFAIHIIPEENLLTCRSMPTVNNQQDQFTNIEQYYFMFIWKTIYNYLNEVKNKKSIYYDYNNINTKIDFLFNKISNIFENIVYIMPYVNILLTNNIYKPYNLKLDYSNLHGYENFLQLLVEDYENISFPIRDERKFIWEQLQLFYCTPQEYKEQIIKKLDFENIDFNLNKNSYNIYLIYLIYIQTFWKIYNSQEYQEFINMLIL